MISVASQARGFHVLAMDGPGQGSSNLQKIRVQEKDGRVHRVRMCMRCLKKGGIQKPQRRQVPQPAPE